MNLHNHQSQFIIIPKANGHDLILRDELFDGRFPIERTLNRVFKLLIHSSEDRTKIFKNYVVEPTVLSNLGMDVKGRSKSIFCRRDRRIHDSAVFIADDVVAAMLDDVI